MIHKVKLTNDFHNTSVTLHLKGSAEDMRCGMYLSDHQIKRARKTLCGVKGCTCGGKVGERGKQNIDVAYEYDGMIYVYDRNFGRTS